MSVTKSFTGTLAAVLVAEGLLDKEKPVVNYVPELGNSAFADATVRQVMDMTTALKYSEDYADPTAEMVIVRFASHPVAANAANAPYSLPAYAAVARRLMERN